MSPVLNPPSSDPGRPRGLGAITVASVVAAVLSLIVRFSTGAPGWGLAAGLILIVFSRVLVREAVGRDNPEAPERQAVMKLFGGPEGWLFFWTMILVLIGLGFTGDALSKMF